MNRPHYLTALFGVLAFHAALHAHASDTKSAAGSPFVTDREFKTPPASARPRVWWHWLNGNITKDGIRKDLEWMTRVGIGGVQNFDAAWQTPQIVEHRLAYMTPEWKVAFRYAVGLADQKGLEFTIASSPGWSETGGPWVPPKDGMKKLVWSETDVRGGAATVLSLPAPPGISGPFQDMALMASGRPTTGLEHAGPAYYADVAVLAFPIPDAAPATPDPVISTAAGRLAGSTILTDGNYQKALEVPIGNEAQPGFVIADFGTPATVRALTLAARRDGAPFGGGQVLPVLERETEAGAWEKIVDVPVAEGVPTTVAFAPVVAQRFRIVFKPQPPRFPRALQDSAPGAVTKLFPAQTPKSLKISELRFFNDERIDRYEAKAGFEVALDYFKLGSSAPSAAQGIAPNTVIDLTSRLRSDGILDWVAPPGRWKVIRFGYSLEGTTNHPASPEATGLEVDKYDGAAVRRYLEHYIGMMKDAAGPDLVGAHGIRALLTDSTEVGPSNWTPQLLAQFKKLRGYDAMPWLPALTGRVVGTRAQSDKFLFDFRATLAELMETEHYGQVARTAHENGLKVYGEALERNRSTFGNELAMRRNTDFPMAALWTYAPDKGPKTELFGDMKGAASVAHIDGQNLVAAELLTSAFAPWAFAPADLKPVIDLAFVYGINRPVIHTSVHQPLDKSPGLPLGPYGQYFNRHETWAEMARPWVDYISRSALLLQQGRYFADLAYFYGEDAPLNALYAKGVPPELPTHYGFDFVDRDMLFQQLKVLDGDLVAQSGARFKALYLGGSSAHMTLALLERIAQLAEEGATIIGKAPVSSPALADDAAAYAALVARLWSGEPETRIGKGRVVASDAIEDSLEHAGVTPDFRAGEGADIMFLHRRINGGDLYFLTNRKSSATRTEARFRVTGKVPELWHAESGTHEPVSYRIEGASTVVPLDMKANDAVFVVFREPAKRNSRLVTAVSDKPIETIRGAWKVQFEAGRGAPAGITLPVLKSLSESEIPGIRYFSGIATYSTEIQRPKGVRPGQALMLDLGNVADVAEVFVNGTSAGIAWLPPYRVDIGPHMRPGPNRIDVKVANLWVNRLIGDAQPGTEKVGFTTMPTYLPDAPLRPAGLLGPVTLLKK
ncbi:glycosyl hydrolase [Telluria sp. Tellsp104]